jgi:hypothetical protein
MQITHNNKNQEIDPLIYDIYLNVLNSRWKIKQSRTQKLLSKITKHTKLELVGCSLPLFDVESMSIILIQPDFIQPTVILGEKEPPHLDWTINYTQLLKRVAKWCITSTVKKVIPHA